MGSRAAGPCVESRALGEANRSVSSKFVAMVMIVAVQMIFLPAFGDPHPASISGAVFSHGGKTPLVGARVHAGNPQTGEVFSSELTATDGAFRMTTLPPADYQLAVEADGGLYLVHTPVSLEAGQDRRVQLAVNASDGSKPRKKPEDDDDDNGGLTLWSNAVTATLLVVGIAVILGKLLEDVVKDDPVATRSTT